MEHIAPERKAAPQVVEQAGSGFFGQEAGSEFSTDGRPETAQLKQLQAAADASPQVQQFRELQQNVTDSPMQQEAIQRKGTLEQHSHVPLDNRGGLPDGLRSGIEQLSGMDMGDVRVHRNSGKAGEAGALAYAQGSDIHLAPGQEQHLPHEAWHVVQQRQGRVQPTTQAPNGAAVNDDAALEAEADAMGAKAMQMKMVADHPKMLEDGPNASNVLQMVRYQPARPGGRVTKPKFICAIANLDFIIAATYEASEIKGAGGKLSTATLGPTGSFSSSSSDADPKLPTAIVAARKKYPNSYFKAGHLLNAQFGGDGKTPHNLTILSATGNANHKAFDQPIKQALSLLYKAYELLWKDGVDISSVGIGIEVKVAVDTASPWAGETAIFQTLKCTASVTNWDPAYNEISAKKNKDDFVEYMTKIEALCTTATNNGTINNPA